LDITLWYIRCSGGAACITINAGAIGIATGIVS
jgi:hypothetical protein